MALSAAALAAEAGLAWLRRRIESGPPTTALAVRQAPAARPASTPAEIAKSPVRSVVTIISQRVVEVWESADGKRQISEHHVWRRIEE